MANGTALAEGADTATANGLKAGLYLHNYTVGNDGIITLGEKKADKSVLTALDQNLAKKVTAIVYLDGDIVDNTMVANAASSMTGSLNLQFSSSAALKPMENTGMRGGGSTGTTTPVTYTKVKEAGDSYEKTVGETTYIVEVNKDYVIYQAGENYYYMYNNDGRYVLMTNSSLLSGACPAVTVTVKQAQTGN